MTRVYEILFKLLLCMLGTDCESDLNRTKIVEKARLLCDRHDICSMSNSHIFKIEDVSNCCYQCSCEPSCKKHGNCCFPDQAYPIGNDDEDDDIGRSDLQNETSLVYECLYPSSPQPIDTKDRIQSQSFWMVSEIVNAGRPSINQTCGNLEAAPWGSFLPVSSKKTGLIYKNIYCAKEHNVKEEDIVAWEGYYICGSLRGIVFDLSDEKLGKCQKQFSPPNSITLKASSLCLNSLIDTCSEEDFAVPMYLNMARSEIVDACTSGFVSPYRTHRMFANIFCHICNGYSPANPLECYNLLVGTQRSTGSISGLLDHHSFRSFSGNKGVRRDPPKACISRATFSGTIENNCKTILCPFGQVRDSEGKCIYSTLEWNNIVFHICLQLTSSTPFNIRHYFPSNPVDISNVASPLLKSLKIETILYKKINPFTDTDELLIRITKPTLTTKTNFFMNTVKKYINKKWLLKSYNATLSLNSELSKEAFWDAGSFTSEIASYQRLYSNAHAPASVKPSLMSKLYFCENIQLESHEFNMFENTLFIKSSNRTLYGNEFSYVKSEQNGVCRVCLSSSGYKATRKNSSVRNSLSLEVSSSVLCVLIIILMNANDSLL